VPAFADLRAAVVRILDSAGEPIGVGFAVGEREFVTCAHVVEEALGLSNGDRPDRSAIVRFDAPFAAPGQVIAATVARWPAAGAQDDIVGLRATGPVATGLRAMHLLGVDEPWGHRFRVFGFPLGHDQGF
jgi:hypothetical protein